MSTIIDKCRQLLTGGHWASTGKRLSALICKLVSISFTGWVRPPLAPLWPPLSNLFLIYLFQSFALIFFKNLKLFINLKRDSNSFDTAWVRLLRPSPATSLHIFFKKVLFWRAFSQFSFKKSKLISNFNL